MVSGAIVDLDGTVYRGDDLIPGAAAGVDALREHGCGLCFFSNNPTKDGAAYVDRLRELGVDAREGEACSAGVATTRYLADHHPDDPVLLVGDEGLAEQLRAADVRLTDDPAEASVLLGSWTNDFDYYDMLAAMDAVEEDTVFLGSDPDRAVPHDDGRLIRDAQGNVIENPDNTTEIKREEYPVSEAELQQFQPGEVIILDTDGWTQDRLFRLVDVLTDPRLKPIRRDIRMRRGEV